MPKPERITWLVDLWYAPKRALTTVRRLHSKVVEDRSMLNAIAVADQRVRVHLKKPGSLIRASASRRDAFQPLRRRKVKKGAKRGRR